MKRLIFALLFTTYLAADTSFWLGTGWRQDSLNWNIAGYHHEPNVLSELKWKSIQMWEIAGGFKTQFFDCVVFKFYGDYAKVFSGRVTDQDFAGDDRTLMYSESKSKANKGEAFDLSLGLGYPFTFCDFTITPLIGYAHMEQHFRIIHGRETVDELDHILRSFPDLHSNYRTKWNSFWIGADNNYLITDDINVYANVEGHFAHYKATGHWNLRTDFADDFKHHGYGWGLILSGGASYQLCNQLYVGLGVLYRYFHIHHGCDETSFFEGDTVVVGKSSLNAVNWHSFSAGLAIGYGF